MGKCTILLQIESNVQHSLVNKNNSSSTKCVELLNAVKV